MENHIRPCDTLLIGSIATESVTSQLKAVGKSYVNKLLDTSPSNWDTLIKIWEEDKPKKVIIRLNERSVFYSTLPEYQSRLTRITTLLKRTPHIVLAPERMSHAAFLCFDSDIPVDPAKTRSLLDAWCEWHGPASFLVDYHRTQMCNFVKSLLDADVSAISYSTLAEMNVLAQQFLADQERGVLLRLYVPSSRIWSAELERLLGMFRDYVTRVARCPVALEQTRTSSGTLYTFSAADEPATKELLESKLGDFTAFIDLCASDAHAAELLLRNSDLPAEEAHDLVQRFSREARRVLVDMEYEKKRRLLALQHRLHAEVLDMADGVGSELVQDFLDPGRGENPSTSRAMQPFSPSVIHAGTVNVNVRDSKIIAAARDVVSSEYFGVLPVSAEEAELLAAIRKHAITGTEIAQLESAIAEAKDPGLPKPQRLTAKRRLGAFLTKVGSQLGERALDVLQKYVEYTLMGGQP